MSPYRRWRGAVGRGRVRMNALCNSCPKRTTTSYLTTDAQLRLQINAKIFMAYVIISRVTKRSQIIWSSKIDRKSEKKNDKFTKRITTKVIIKHSCAISSH